PVLRKESTGTGRPGNCERRSEKSSEGVSELLDKLRTDSAYSMNPDQLAELKADHATAPLQYRRICMKRRCPVPPRRPGTKWTRSQAVSSRTEHRARPRRFAFGDPKASLSAAS